MNTEQFMKMLLAEAQAQLDFNRQAYGERFDQSEMKSMALSDALDGFSAVVSMQDFAAMLEEGGGLKAIETTVVGQLI